MFDEGESKNKFSTIEERRKNVAKMWKNLQLKEMNDKGSNVDRIKSTTDIDKGSDKKFLIVKKNGKYFR